MAASEITSDVPPNETRGSGTPVMGRDEVTAPMLTSACREIQIVIPDAISMPKRSGALTAVLMPMKARKRNRPSTPKVPRSPSSSPMMA